MREIKFRAWGKVKEHWIENFMSIPMMAGMDLIFIATDIEITQYTGLKDKTGKEIYCSDIVKGYFNPDEVEDYIWLSLTDTEKETGVRIFVIPEDIVEFAREQYPDELEVIGNIYENPELLKE